MPRPGVITGTELARLTDDDVLARLPRLHVFGRVAPEDKLRLAQLMQQDGQVVAMTGDAVNDAAALKQADVGVAMGCGGCLPDVPDRRLIRHTARSGITRHG